MRTLTPRRLVAVLGASAGLLALAVFLAPEFGSADASFWRVLTGAARPDERRIIFSLRLPRVILAVLAGGGLAVCGGSMQAVLGNPLACPYTLGIAGGAAFGAVLAMKLDPSAQVLGGALVPAAAFLGALAATALVMGLARVGRRGGLTKEGLLLAGVTVGFIGSAGVLMAQYLSEPLDVARMVRWLMGGFEVVGWRVLVRILPALVPGLVLLFWQSARLNQIALSEEVAASRGVDVPRVRSAVLWGTALATGGLVAVAGPVAFVGLLVPHLVRLFVGPDFRLLLPCAFFAGGALLAACDTVARTVVAPSQIPVGVITALLGGPFFLWALVRRG